MSETQSAASRTLVERAADWLMAQALNDAELEVVVCAAAASGCTALACRWRGSSSRSLGSRLLSA